MEVSGCVADGVGVKRQLLINALAISTVAGVGILNCSRKYSAIRGRVLTRCKNDMLIFYFQEVPVIDSILLTRTVVCRLSNFEIRIFQRQSGKVF